MIRVGMFWASLERLVVALGGFHYNNCLRQLRRILGQPWGSLVGYAVRGLISFQVMIEAVRPYVWEELPPTLIILDLSEH